MSIKKSRAAIATALAAAALAGAGGAAAVAAALGDDPMAAPATQVTVTNASAAATAGSSTVGQIYKRTSAAVVEITVTSAGQADPLGGSQRTQQAQGSGFVYDTQGHVITNQHVVDGAQSVSVRFANGKTYSAKVVGSDPSTDIAVIDVDAPASELKPISLADSSAVEVGDGVIAIGSPFGLEQTVTTGIVSALHRQITAPNNFSIDDAIQTDAAINHGNSGGPLLDASGNVLGINAQIQTSTGEGSGVGFAISADTVRRSLDQLRESGRARYAYLGVATSPMYPQLAERFDLPVDHGAWVQDVTPGGPADDASLRGGSGAQEFQGRQYRTGGDLIVAVGRQQIREEADVAKALVGLRPGSEVDLQVYRDGDRRTLRVKLGERPLDAPRAG
jgi:2-alkenal reductase